DVLDQVQGRQNQDPLAVLDQVQQKQPQPESTLSWHRRQVGLGYQEAGQKLSDIMMSGYEIGRSALHGDFRPLRETAEMAGRGLMSTAGYLAAGAPEDPKIQQIRQSQAKRREASGDIYWRGSQIEHQRLAEEEAKDQSLGAKVVRGVTSGAILGLPY